MTESTETTYAEEAAAELRKARADNEERAAGAAALHSGLEREALKILAEVNARRVEIAEGFARLAAIERNLPPCYHPLRPEPEAED